jgi:pyrroloquinoline quinone biosynthesis protein D
VSNSAPTANSGHPRVAPLYRLQWEQVQQAHVLLFPEGMVKLNGSAGQILLRCDGMKSLAEIIADLENAFATTGLGTDVEAFLKFATDKGWVEWVDR